MFSDSFDFYDWFDKYPEQFKQAQSYEEFCELVGTPLASRLKEYRWVPQVFECAKVRKRTYRPLRFPRAERFVDLFEAAVFVATPEHGKPSQVPAGYKFLGGTASLCGHVGGKRGWSERTPDTRAHFGAKFYGMYVRPRSEVHNLAMTLAEHPHSYEAIRRTDGILILAHDGHSIGQDWLALLPLTENIEDMLDQKTREMIAGERQAAKDAWGEDEEGF